MDEYIGRFALINALEAYQYDAGKDGYGIMAVIGVQPAADVVEVVRCKDCCLGKLWSDGSVSCQRLAVENDYMADLWMKPDDFCSYGERRNNAAD